jgi:hypothetical protein
MTVDRCTNYSWLPSWFVPFFFFWRGLVPWSVIKDEWPVDHICRLREPSEQCRLYDWQVSKVRSDKKSRLFVSEWKGPWPDTPTPTSTGDGDEYFAAHGTCTRKSPSICPMWSNVLVQRLSRRKKMRSWVGTMPEAWEELGQQWRCHADIPELGGRAGAACHSDTWHMDDLCVAHHGQAAPRWICTWCSLRTPDDWWDRGPRAYACMHASQRTGAGRRPGSETFCRPTAAHLILSGIGMQQAGRTVHGANCQTTVSPDGRRGHSARITSG